MRNSKNYKIVCDFIQKHFEPTFKVEPTKRYIDIANIKDERQITQLLSNNYEVPFWVTNYNVSISGQDISSYPATEKYFKIQMKELRESLIELVPTEILQVRSFIKDKLQSLVRLEIENPQSWPTEFPPLICSHYNYSALQEDFDSKAEYRLTPYFTNLQAFCIGVLNYLKELTETGVPLENIQKPKSVEKKAKIIDSVWKGFEKNYTDRLKKLKQQLEGYMSSKDIKIFCELLNKRDFCSKTILWDGPPYKLRALLDGINLNPNFYPDRLDKPKYEHFAECMTYVGRGRMIRKLSDPKVKLSRNKYDMKNKEIKKLLQLGQTLI